MGQGEIIKFLKKHSAKAFTERQIEEALGKAKGSLYEPLRSLKEHNEIKYFQSHLPPINGGKPPWCYQYKL
jgi:hypothetical protein